MLKSSHLLFHKKPKFLEKIKENNKILFKETDIADWTLCLEFYLMH